MTKSVSYHESTAYLLMYIYDANGSPIGFTVKNAGGRETYWYDKNLQGDVVSVYNSAGTILVNYTYDAWGVPTVSYVNGGASTNAAKNNLGYRGYYYDADLEMYYLQSRYYDAKVCRFISPDNLSYLGANGDLVSYNLFPYCSNNPVNGIDPTGKWTFAFNIGLFVGILGGYSINIGIAVDSDSMVAFQWTYSVPNDETTRNTVIGATLGIGVNFQYTDLNSVTELEKSSKSAGVNTPIGTYEEVLTKYGNEKVGVNIGVGPSLGGDFHVNETYTKTIGKPFKGLFDYIKEWLGF